MRPKSTWEPTSMKMNSRMMNAVVETNAAIADVGRLSRPPSWITGHEKPTGFHPRVLAPRAYKDHPSMPGRVGRPYNRRWGNRYSHGLSGQTGRCFILPVISTRRSRPDDRRCTARIRLNDGNYSRIRRNTSIEDVDNAEQSDATILSPGCHHPKSDI